MCIWAKLLRQRRLNVKGLHCRVPSEAPRVFVIIGLGVINQSIYHNKGVKTIYRVIHNICDHYKMQYRGVQLFFLWSTVQNCWSTKV